MKLVYVFFLMAALWLIQCLVGGTRLVFSLPSYSILAVGSLLTLVSLRRSRPAPDLACLIVSAVFFGYILIRAALSPITYLWWTDFYMVLACLLVYLLTALYVTHSRLRSYIIGALLLIAVVQAFIGLRQFSVADDWMPFGFLRKAAGRRASGMMISPIHFAGYLEAIGVVGLSMALWSTWKGWLRGLAGYAAGMCYLGVVISGSRGGYLSSAFSLAVFAALSLWALRRASPRRFPAVAIATLLAAAALMAGVVFGIRQSADLSRRLDNLFGTREAAHDVRIYNWQAALDQFRVAPVVGTGAGTHLYYGRFFRRPELQADPEHAHSDYLELLAEYGLVGALGMVAFLFLHLSGLFRSIAQNTEVPDDDPFHPVRDTRLAIQIGVLSAVAAYLAHSVVDFNLHIPANALLFAFFFGIAANPQSLATSPEKSIGLIRVFQIAFGLLAAGMLGFGAPKFPGDYFCEKARIALRDRKFAESIVLGRRAMEYERHNPFIYYHLAGAYAGLGMSDSLASRRKAYLEEAVTSARTGLVLFPADEHALARLAGILHELGRYREAGEEFRAAIAISPNLGRLRALYARHLALIGRHDEAVAELNEARRLGSSIDLTTLVDEAQPQISDEIGPSSAF